MIICLSGRIKSGKSTIANHLVTNKGFKKISIAYFLKESIAKLYDIDILNCFDQNLKNKKRNDLKWNSEIARKYAVTYDLDFNKLYFGTIDDRFFEDVRGAMTYIGTNILRRYDENFHVKRALLEVLDENENYICDDVRFHNEKKAFEKAGATCFFILRPHNFEYLNHISETSLTCKDFDRFIINDGSLTKLINNSNDSFFNQKNIVINVDHTIFIYKNITDAFWAGFIQGNGSLQFDSSNNKYKLVISSEKNKIVQDFCKFLKIDLPMYIKTTTHPDYPAQYFVETDNPFILENIKLWDIK